MTTDPILAAAKTALRLEARARRKALMIEHPEADWMAADHAPAMLAALKRTRPGVLAIYKALGAELDPRPLADTLARAGWTITLPAVVAEAAPLVFRAWTPGQPLVHDLAGLPAPSAAAEEISPDLVMVPLLAFDAGGGRLGQGGGHYDRTLEAMRNRPSPPSFVGMAYSGQQVAALPREPHDQPLDGILTEAGYIGVRKDH